MKNLHIPRFKLDPEKQRHILNEMKQNQEEWYRKKKRKVSLMKVSKLCFNTLGMIGIIFLLLNVKTMLHLSEFVRGEDTIHDSFQLIENEPEIKLRNWPSMKIEGTESTYLFVKAGALAKDQQQGVIEITLFKGKQKIFTESFKTIEKHGSLFAQCKSDSTIYIQADDGTAWNVDVSKLLHRDETIEGK